VAVLFAYFRRIRDVVACLAGVTLAVPVVLGAMRALGQPFSIGFVEMACTGGGCSRIPRLNVSGGG
jgi:predicted RND superfamily exporter protein